MPIYEYRCESCGIEIEKLQKMSDPALKDCPECGAAALVKMISASSFRLKGTGWYETDFKTGKKKNVVTDSDAGTSGSGHVNESGKDSGKDNGKSTVSDSKEKKVSSKGAEKSSGQNKSAASGS